MLVRNVVASITPKVAEQSNAAHEQTAGEFGSVLGAAAAEEAKASEEVVQPDAAEVKDAPQAAETTGGSCSCGKSGESAEGSVEGVDTSSKALELNSGGYAICFSWYVRVADEVRTAESPAVRLFHDVAERISDVFLNDGGWRGNPIQALLSGTESVVQNDARNVGSYLGNLLSSAKTGVQSLVQALNGGSFLSGFPSSSSSSSSGSSSSGLIETAFDTSYLTQIAIAKLQYGNSSNVSIGNGINSLGGSASSVIAELSGSFGADSVRSTAKPLPRNRQGGQLVMVSNDGTAVSPGGASDGATDVSSDIGTGDAARRFLEAFKLFVETLKREESQKQAEKADEAAITAQADAAEKAKDAPEGATAA